MAWGFGCVSNTDESMNKEVKRWILEELIQQQENTCTQIGITTYGMPQTFRSAAVPVPYTGALPPENLCCVVLCGTGS